jgi:serine/threonine-protein kinase SRPK3
VLRYPHRYGRGGKQSARHDGTDQSNADLKPDNILLGIEDPTVIDEFVRDEAENPSPRKTEGSRGIYSCRNFGDFRKPPGRPKLTDFGLAVRGDISQPHNHPIQPDLFQAPEVIIRASWTYSVDVWNLGVMVSFQIVFEYYLPT